MAILLTRSLCVTTSTRNTSVSFPTFSRTITMSIVFLTLLTFTNGVTALSEALEGHCSYVRSTSTSYQTTVSFSEMVKTKRDCGFLGWSSCTHYREVYKTRLVIRYRLVYKTAYRCCEGWIESAGIVPLPECIKIIEPTTTVTPRNTSSTSQTIPTAELPVNYSVITTESAAIVIAEVDITDHAGTLPGGPVSTNPGGPGGGMFTGDKKIRNMIGLIGTIAGVLLIIILITVIALCYRRRRRKRERKLSNPVGAYELLSRGERTTSPSNGRPPDSAYAEIPDGQTQTHHPITSATATCDAVVSDGADENHETPSPCPRGGNQYQEIADLLHQAGDTIPSPASADSYLPDESHGGYAYAYIDTKHLQRDGVEDTNGSEGNVELKGGANAKYAEVQKVKAVHPKSPGTGVDDDQSINVSIGEHEVVIPTEIQAYITHVPTNPDEDETWLQQTDAESKSSKVTDNPEPYDEVTIGMSPKPYDEVQFSKRLDPEPYDEVKIGASMIPQTVEFDNFQSTDGTPGHVDNGNDGPQPYGDLDPHPYGETGLLASSPDGTQYDQFQRSNSRHDLHEIEQSGYGVVLGDVQDATNKRGSNQYATLDGQTSNEVARIPPKPPQSREYDRLDRQISTTSTQHGSATNSLRQNMSPNYSKLNRSTSRQEGGRTSPSGYGALGDDGHAVLTETYDKLNNGSQLSALVPVQDFYDLPKNLDGQERGHEDSELPEGSYATIPNDLFRGLSRDANDDINPVTINKGLENNGIQSCETAATVYDTPSASRSSTVTRQETNGYDTNTLYENTPKGNRDSTLSSGNGGSNHVTIPASRSSLIKQDNIDETTSANSTYDTPASHFPFRQNSIGSTTPETYDTPPSRNSVARQNSEHGPDNRGSGHNETYDTPRNSISRHDTLYENAAKAKIQNNNSPEQKPVQYEFMDRGSRISNASTGSYYEDMQRGHRSSLAGSRGSRGSLDIAIPSPISKTPLTRKDTVYENSARDGNK